MAIGQSADVEDGCRGIGECSLLGGMQMTAEMEARANRLQEVEEAALAAGTTGRGSVGDTERAPMR
jgi:hypothetical protein